MDKTIKFTNNYAPYVKGDIAGFDEELSKRYIEMGIAKEWTEKVSIVNKAGDENVTDKSGKSKKLSTNK
jgi:hypothetical protein